MKQTVIHHIIPCAALLATGGALAQPAKNTAPAADYPTRFGALGLESQGGRPERPGALLRGDTERWSKVVKAVNVRSE